MATYLVLLPAAAIAAVALWGAMPALRRPGPRGPAIALAVFAVPCATTGSIFLTEAALAARGFSSPEFALAAALAPAVAFAILAAIGRLIPWGRAWKLLGLPLLLGAGPFLLGPSISPHVAVPMVGFAVLMLSAWGPAFVIARTQGMPRFGHAALSTTIALAMGLCAVWGLALTFIMATEGGGFMLADHAWSAEFTPDSDEAYVLVVPFFETEDARAETTLANMRERLRVTGDATTTFVDANRAVEIHARGPISVETSFQFHGHTGLREAFLGYRLPPIPALLSNGSMPGGTLVWAANLSGGAGHTCWAQHTETLALRAGEPSALRIQGDVSASAAAPRHMPTLCA